MQRERFQLTEKEAASALQKIGLVVASYHDQQTVLIEDRDFQGNHFTPDTAGSHAQYQLSRVGINRVVTFKPCTELLEGKS